MARENMYRGFKGSRVRYLGRPGAPGDERCMNAPDPGGPPIIKDKSALRGRNDEHQ
jgi:hypothetical protein